MAKRAEHTSLKFPWSLAAHRQSLAFRACLYDEKNEAPEEEAVSEVYILPGVNLRRLTWC